MKQQITEALKKSLIPDQKSIKQATSTINALRRNKGFFLSLMQIADQITTYPTQIRQSALANLKVSIERRWVKTEKWKADFLIDQEQKAQIRKNLFEGLLRSNKDPKFLNLYKAIIKIIISYDYAIWLPVGDVINALSLATNPTNTNINPNTLPSILHFTVSMFNALELHIDNRRVFMEEMIAKIYPVLFSIVQTHRTVEIIYLVTKIVWKGLHMELRAQAKEESMRWIPLLLEVIKSSHPQISQQYSHEMKKYTQEYYYFHTKKWATRTIWRFVQRHANYKYHKQSKPFSDLFYQQFGVAVAQALMSQVLVPTIPKVKFFILKALNAVAQTRPMFLQPYAKDLLYRIIPPFLMLTPDDQKLAKQDPMQVLKLQLDPVQNSTNTKRAAMDLWNSLNQIGSKANSSTNQYTPGTHLYESMEYLKAKLTNNTNLLEKEMAMYILCQMWTMLFKIQQIKQILPILIDNFIIPEFSNPVMFLRARAVQVFSQYGTIPFPDLKVLQKAVDGIYRCLTSDPDTIVRIKAACSFNCILSHPEAIDMVRPHLNSVLTIYIGMLEKYDLDDIVSSLQGIVLHFSKDISPFAVELVQRLSKFFLKYCQIDLEKTNKDANYEGEVEMAASGCLSAIARIIESPVPIESIPALESFVIECVSYSLTEDGVDYLSDAMEVLGLYLLKTPNISQQIWFFYPTLIYYIIGLENLKVNASILDNVPLINPQQAQIFKNLQKEKSTELHEIIPSLRFFILKGMDVILTQTDFFGSNMILLLFKLADAIYKQGPQENQEIDSNYASITSLFVFFLECTNNKNALQAIWNIVKANLNQQNNKSRFLRVINSQLIAMCLYLGPLETLTIMEAQGSTDQVFSSIISNQHRFHDQWEKQRMILGLSTLFKITNRPTSLDKFLPAIFKFLCRQIRLVSYIRTPGPGMGDDDCPSDPESASQDDQDEDMWSENHEKLYKSPLQTVDEVAYFEQCLKTMQAQQGSKYIELINTLSQQQMLGLNEWVSKAKQEFIKHIGKRDQKEAPLAL